MLQLYNVVVDTELTGKSLLKNGQLKRRCTIIPLNKVVSHSINPQTVKRAQSLVSHVSHAVVDSYLPDWSTRLVHVSSSDQSNVSSLTLVSYVGMLVVLLTNKLHIRFEKCNSVLCIESYL